MFVAMLRINPLFPPVTNPQIKADYLIDPKHFLWKAINVPCLAIK